MCTSVWSKGNDCCSFYEAESTLLGKCASVSATLLDELVRDYGEQAAFAFQLLGKVCE
jgi:hypothetical protein